MVSLKGLSYEDFAVFFLFEDIASKLEKIGPIFSSSIHSLPAVRSNRRQEEVSMP